VARAAAAAGDSAARDEHLALARALLAQEPDEEDRAVVLAQVEDVPVR
jgi:hypothetical protein